MSTIQEFTSLRVPEKSRYAYQDGANAFSISDTLKPAQASFEAGKPFEPESLPKVHKALSNISKTSRFFEWTRGNQSKSPFKEKEILQVKSDLLSLWEHFSSSLMIQAVVQTILIADAYLEYFSFLSSGDTGQSIPYWDLMVPVANLYINLKKASEAIQHLCQATTNEEAEKGYASLATATAASLKFLFKLIAYYCLYQVSPLAELILVTTAYIGNLVELSEKEYEKKSKDIDFLARQPRTIILRA